GAARRRRSRRSGGAAGRRRSKRGGGAAASFKANALVQGVPRHQQRRSRRGADIERCTIRQLRCAVSERCETCALSEPCETCCALNERRGGECIRPSRPQSRSPSFISWITEARSH